MAPIKAPMAPSANKPFFRSASLSSLKLFIPSPSMLMALAIAKNSMPSQSLAPLASFLTDLALCPSKDPDSMDSEDVKDSVNRLMTPSNAPIAPSARRPFPRSAISISLSFLRPSASMFRAPAMAINVVPSHRLLYFLVTDSNWFPLNRSVLDIFSSKSLVNSTTSPRIPPAPPTPRSVFPICLTSMSLSLCIASAMSQMPPPTISNA